MQVLRHQLIGFSGALVGCACTAFAPNSLWLKIVGFSGVVAFMVCIHVVWHQKLKTVGMDSEMFSQKEAQP